MKGKWKVNLSNSELGIMVEALRFVIKGDKAGVLAYFDTQKDRALAEHLLMKLREEMGEY